MVPSKSVAALTAAVALLALGASLRPAWAQEFTDADITAAVEREFLADATVPFNLVDVATDRGIVTLTGQVGNLGAKMQAERLAETIKGVRSVVDRISVMPSELAPEAIRRSVVAALVADPATDSYELNVTVDGNGTVTLNGRVQSWAEHELAARVAAGVRGVRAISNMIDVDYDAERSDGDVEADIQQRLHWDTLVDDALIAVAVHDGQADLTGTVGSAAEARRAGDDAWVNGVTAVDTDQLDVERWARDDDLRTAKYTPKSDDAIRKAVKDALLYDPRVGHFNIDVDVHRGQVRLHGIVGDLQAKRAAADTARNTVGVLDVQNYLRVRPAQHLADATIDGKVRDAFLRDALVDSDNIIVDVDGGTVRLYGLVDSALQKNQAEDLASRIPGVTDVRSYLSVRRPDTAVPVRGVYGWYPYSYFYPYANPLEPDSQIAQHITEQLFWSPFIDSEDVMIMVDDGVATLTGKVQTWREREAAVHSAYEGGARRVKDELEVVAG